MPEIYKPHPSDLWETPPEVFEPLDEIFHFELDLAAERETSKCLGFFSPENDAFKHPWDRPAFLNPPYRSKERPLEEWLERAVRDSRTYGVPIVCLVKAATETKWFQPVWQHAQLIVFFRKRIQFLFDGERLNSARFPNALAVFGPAQHSSVAWSLTQFGYVIRAGRRGLLLPEDLR